MSRAEDRPRATGPGHLRLIGWIGAVALALGIFLESGSPDAGGVLLHLPPGSDKLGHALGYALLAACLTLATGRPRWAVVAAGLYGLSDELHQSFVPGRSADVFDLVADVGGALLGAPAVAFLRRRWRARRIE